MSNEETKILMAPYRRRIDELDRQIIQLLRERYDVIEEVGEFKTHKNIEPILQDRVDEVRENARTMAAEQNLDADFIADLYAQLIAHSCALEEKIKQKIQNET